MPENCCVCGHADYRHAAARYAPQRPCAACSCVQYSSVGDTAETAHFAVLPAEAAPTTECPKCLVVFESVYDRVRHPAECVVGRYELELRRVECLTSIASELERAADQLERLAYYKSQER